MKSEWRGTNTEGLSEAVHAAKTMATLKYPENKEKSHNNNQYHLKININMHIKIHMHMLYQLNWKLFYSKVQLAVHLILFL